MIKWILFLNSILLYYNMICEDVIRPESFEDCFNRTFVGEFNNENAYCCFLNMEKGGVEINKCSIHFKDEIDNGTIDYTIQFLTSVNTHYENEEVIINKLQCKNKSNYFKKNFLIEILIYIFIELFS